MPLDQFFAAHHDPDSSGSRSSSGKPSWAIPISGPADLDRLWAERQNRRAMTNG